MSGESMNDNVILAGLSRGCVSYSTLDRILEGAHALSRLDILPADVPEEVEDMAQIACGPCDDSVLCESVDDFLELSIAKYEMEK